MKPLSFLTLLRTPLIAALLLSQLSACGQKGPLYLPAKTVAPTVAPTVTPTAPAATTTPGSTPAS